MFKSLLSAPATRCFSTESALASMETGLTGFDEIEIEGAPEDSALIAALSRETPDRLRVIAQAMRHGMSDDAIFTATAFAPWFLARIRKIIEAEEQLRQNGLPADAQDLRALKMLGFTDARLAHLTGQSEADVRRARKDVGVTAVFKRIDTCAAEFEAQTPYMYSTYESPVMVDVECEARPSGAKKVVILGGGPNRIGQGIEFDYCCCHACYALTEAGYETIMVNCNPETVSTDYDTSDRLYFEPLTFEHVMEILRVEQDNGTLCDGTDVHVAGIMQHIEEAGVHSGDSACSLPPYSLPAPIIARDRGADPRAGAGAERRRADERAVRGEGW